MKKEVYHVIGVMSGTSLDGLDLCYVQFSYTESWSFKIITSETLPYSKIWMERLKRAIDLPMSELKLLDKSYTKYFGEAISKFIKGNSIENIDAVCSHGHTVFHQPEEGFTYQIGNMPILATIVNQKVICDFRVQDVFLRGQGAPLVPIGDKLLFHNYNFCLNLGGFANISFEKENVRIAYDICPVNIVLNYYVRDLGFDYDDNGEIARSGQVKNTLLEVLNALKFYKLTAPKSLGLEWVVNEVIPIIDKFNFTIKDILRTFVEHISIQISSEINKMKNANVFITGGGVFNSFLIERIEYYSNNEIVIPSKDIVDFKEALIFGFLGVLKLRDEVNCLSSVTGAIHDHSSGEIFLP